MNTMIKPLDFVRTPKGAIALVTGIRTTQGVFLISIAFIGDNYDEKNAWWRASELEVIDSLPHLLAKNVAHPFDFDCIKTAEELFSIATRQ